jgi:uncharacterized protein Smg (DUF494 family)
MSTGSTLKTLYEIDYMLWLETTLEQIKHRQIDQIDWDNLAEEIEGLGIALHHKIDSYLRQILIHLLLYQYWTTEREKSGSDWRDKIIYLQDELESLLEQSKTLYNYFLSRIDLIYLRARRGVIQKTQLDSSIFPEKCPFSESELIDFNFYPES